MAVGTNLESKLLEGIGETGERLVAGTSLGHEGQGASRTSDLTVGDLHAGGLRDIVLEGRVGSRGHGPTAGGERTRRISADGGPRQHCAPGSVKGEEKKIRNPLGFERVGRQLRGGMRRDEVDPRRRRKASRRFDYSVADWSE